MRAIVFDACGQGGGMRVAVLAFLAGVIVVQLLPALPPLAWSAAVAASALLLWPWRARLFPLMFVLFGIAWALLRAELVLREALSPALEGQDIRVEGYVADLPRPGERGSRFRFVIEDAMHAGASIETPSTVMLNSYGHTIAPRAGERWEFTVRLKQPHGMQNPGGFDYEAYLFRERIRATGYVRTEPAPQLLPTRAYEHPITRARDFIGRRLRAALPDNPFGGMLVAFVNGDETGIDDTQWQVLQRTGTAHLVAISGMNIGLLAGLAFVCVRRLWSWTGKAVLYWPAPKAAAIAASLVAMLYAALAGFSIPTQRALIMVLVVMGTAIAQVRVPASQVLAVALFAVLLHDPLSVTAAGFWLSFVAVAIILAVIHARHAQRSSWRRFTHMQWAIGIGLLPVILALFQQVPLAGPFANLVAIPLIEIAVIPLSLLAAAMSPFASDAVLQWPLQAAAMTMQALWWMLAPLARVDALQWVQAAPPWWAVLCASVGCAWLLMPRAWPARWVGVLWLLPALLLQPVRPRSGEVWLTLLDVGQGLASVVRTSNHTLVFDTGPRFSAHFDTGRAVVAPFLRAQGITQIDTLVVSHGDNDHIGGAASLRAALPVRRTLSSVPERLERAEPCQASQRWEWDAVEFVMVGPGDARGQSDNNAGCVLWVRSRFGDALLPGDIEARAERELLARVPQLRADVLVAPHHGSKTSSTAEFLAQVKPREVLFAVGYRNSYRHPHAGVVARYRDIDANLRASPDTGAVTATFTADGIALNEYRRDAQRYWFSRPAFPTQLISEK